MMKKIYLNKIIKASNKKPKATKGAQLETNFPFPMMATIFLAKKNNKNISIMCRETNNYLLRLFAKAIFLMYRKEFSEFPLKITFITPEGKKVFKSWQLELVNLDPLINYL